MKIVIDIPNWLYHAIQEHREPVYSQSLGEAVRDGTPLPKGHGRLIDADELIKGLVSNDNTVILAKCADTILEASESESKE